MKITDKELEELVYSVLRRCPEGNDLVAAQRIVDAIVEVEIQTLSDLKVKA